MTRRGLLAGLLGAVVAPELIRIAAPPVPRAFASGTAINAAYRTRSRNRIVTTQEITREALRVLQHDLQVSRSINRNYALEFSR